MHPRAELSRTARGRQILVDKPSRRMTYLSRSGEVEAIEIHHLVPRSHEVTHELLFRVVTCIHLRAGSELGVPTEDEIDAAGGPLEITRLAVVSLEHVLGGGRGLPLRAHLEQVGEEVVGQGLAPVGEDT